jgi:exodeoxyribonuclease V beta subunit
LDPLSVPLRGRHLIEASAGTGKTWNITTLYLRLLLERNLSVDQILVVTYTNAATAELRGRIRKRLADAVAVLQGGEAPDETLERYLRPRTEAGWRERDAFCLGLAVRGFDEAAISTIHGACQRILQENAFESGLAFDPELITDQSGLLGEVVRDFWVRHLHDAPRPLVRAAGKDLSLADLQAIAARLTTQPCLEVIPRGRDADDLAAAIAEHQAAFSAAAEIWQSQRDGVLDALDPARLNHSHGKREKVEGWAAELDVLFDSGEPRGCKVVENFTTTMIVTRTKAKKDPPAHAFFAACERLVAAADRVDMEVTASLVALRVAFADEVHLDLARRKLAARKMFFDDLLQRVHQALRAPGGEALAQRIGHRFPAALIDEFQDTDPIQYAIFDRVFGGDERTLFLIGDPKQSIYAFRGADIFSYIRASRDAEALHTLTVNWRSDPSLIRAVNTVFDRAEPFLFPQIQFEKMSPRPAAEDLLGGSEAGRPPFQILLLRRAEGVEQPMGKEEARARLARAVAAEIVRFLHAGPRIDGGAARPSDIAVLCRANFEAEHVQAELRALGVPSVFQGQSSVFEAPEAEEMERILRALADPTDSRAIVAALATVALGSSSASIARMQTEAAVWDMHVRRFHERHRLWLEAGFVPAFRRLLDDFDVQRRLLSYVDGERRLTNLFHLSELLQRESVESRRGPQSLLEWLARMRRDASARADLAREAAQIRLESDASALQLVTVHKSKGLQYPVVFCPYLWDESKLRDSEKNHRLFHDPEDGNRAKLDVSGAPSAEHLQFAKDELLAENLRLLYVALTRAKHRCTVVWGGFSGSETSALGYLLHQRSDASSQRASATEAYLKEASDVDLRYDVDQVARRAEGAIEVADLSEAPAPRYEGEGAPPAVLDWRRFGRDLDQSWRTSSFSALIANRPLGVPEDEGRDRDEGDVVPEEARVPQSPVVLHELPAGARMGILVHSILEKVDFDAEEATVGVSAADILRRSGMEERWAEPLTRGLSQALRTPLAPEEMRLADIDRSARLSEMEFLFPIGAGAEASRLTRGRLACVFGRHEGPASRPEYLARLLRLTFGDLSGHLRGFVDLVFRHQDRWFVADYKSNRLGPQPRDYRPDRLLEAMDTHHYFLQYHLYAVALHRHLRHRLVGYDPERHLGGVYYLFLRGMSPDHEPGTGVYFDRPRVALIEDLSAVLDGGAEG